MIKLYVTSQNWSNRWESKQFERKWFWKWD